MRLIIQVFGLLKSLFWDKMDRSFALLILYPSWVVTPFPNEYARKCQ